MGERKNCVLYYADSATGIIVLTTNKSSILNIFAFLQFVLAFSFIWDLITPLKEVTLRFQPVTWLGTQYQRSLGESHLASYPKGGWDTTAALCKFYMFVKMIQTVLLLSSKPFGKCWKENAVSCGLPSSVYRKATLKCYCIPWRHT